MFGEAVTWWISESFWKGGATFKFDYQMLWNWNSCFELIKAKQIVQWRCGLDISSHQFPKANLLYKDKIQRRCQQECFLLEHSAQSYRVFIFSTVLQQGVKLVLCKKTPDVLPFLNLKPSAVSEPQTKFSDYRYILGSESEISKILRLIWATGYSIEPLQNVSLSSYILRKNSVCILRFSFM